MTFKLNFGMSQQYIYLVYVPKPMFTSQSQVLSPSNGQTGTVCSLLCIFQSKVQDQKTTLHLLQYKNRVSLSISLFRHENEARQCLCCLGQYKFNIHCRFYQNHAETSFFQKYRRTSNKKCRKAEQAACKDSTKVVFHRRLSFTEGCLPPKVVFHRRSSSTEGHLPPKVV